MRAPLPPSGAQVGDDLPQAINGRSPRHPALSRLPRQAASLVVAIGVLGMLGLLLGPAGIVAAPTARGASSGPTIVTAARYTVLPSQGRVSVVVDVSISNHEADTRVNRFYYDHAFLNVQPGAANPKVTKGPSGASVGIASRGADATTLRLDFAQLFGGHTTSFRFSFDLRDTGTAVQRLVRVGASLVTFPVWAYASDGASGSRVTVQFPKGYDVSVETGSFATQTHASDGGVVLGTNALANPLGFFAFVSAQQPATYLSTQLNVKVADGTIPLTMRAWKDDRSWAGRVGPLFTRSLPLLRSDIGLAWPHDGPVVVQEAVSRSTGGFAGLYDPMASTIQVAYWASSAIVVHEAAHAWFNGTLLADRWAVEGFASLYAQRALTALKIKSSPPELTTKLQAAGFPLNDWPATPAPTAAAESFGYAASYTLAAQILKQAGPDALARVWADAASHIGAYQPPSGQSSTPETVDGAPDWRGLLDLLEAETGSDFTTLWRTWVVRPSDAGQLDRRAAARTAYQGALAAADGWALPRSIRDALRAWRFDTADSLIAQARAALAERTKLEGQASAAGLTLPPTVQRLFEAGDLAGAVTEAQLEESAIAAIGAALDGRAQGRNDMLTSVGMIGLDPELDLTSARAALAAGDTATALTAARASLQMWGDASGEGRRRALMGAALVVALGVMAASLASRALRSRRPSRTRSVAPEP